MSTQDAVESITEGLKDLLTIEIKPRHDPMYDQYSRIFMVKILLACTVVIGVNEYKDTVQCIIPESLDVCDGDSSCDFIVGACWIQGMYVYKQLIDKVSQVAYFGMPINIDKDGYIRGTDDLCELQPKLDAKPSENCIPMEKTFFLQYQWLVYFIATLSIVYYIPYILFCRINREMIRLRAEIKTESISPEEILEEYIKRDETSIMERWMSPLLNVLVKMLYLCANLICFLALDDILHGEYMWYGVRWLQWSQLNNTLMYDYRGMREFPKPGNRLLPPFGYCEFSESARDVKFTKDNKIKLVCEISQHVLYQYCLLLLWFCIAFGILISFLGLCHLLCTYFINYMNIRSPVFGFRNATLRHMEYVSYIKSRDQGLYGEVMFLLQCEKRRSNELLEIM